MKKGGYLKFLNEDQIKDIHYASLEVLQRTGVKIEDEEILELLAEAGAYVEFDKRRAYLPASLVENMIKKAPSRFTWYGRNPEYFAKMEGKRVHFSPCSSVINVIDLDGNRRRATIEDAENFSRILDAIPYITEGHCMVHPSDVPNDAAHAHIMLAIARNTEKCMRGRVFGADRARDCIKMAEVIAGSKKEMEKRPNLICIVNPVSPLILSRDLLEGMKEYVKRSLPVVIAPEVQSGSTGPVTLAGTLVQHNAETLSGIVVTQILNPGTPVVYGSVSTISDMKTGSIAYGAIEAGMINVCVVQMANYYGIPSRTTGGIGESHQIDIQAGLEGATTLLLSALAGSNYIRDSVGGLGSTMTVSYEKIAIDSEILGMVSRALEGIEVSDETLAVDVINKVGPGGQFLGEDHTLKNFKKEHFLPEILSRVPFDTFIENKKDIRSSARQKIRDILQNHQPAPLDREVEKELRNIVKAVEKRVLSK